MEATGHTREPKGLDLPTIFSQSLFKKLRLRCFTSAVQALKDNESTASWALGRILFCHNGSEGCGWQRCSAVESYIVEKSSELLDLEPPPQSSASRSMVTWSKDMFQSLRPFWENHFPRMSKETA